MVVRIVFATLVVALMMVPAAASAAPTVAGCPVFPASNPWNQRVDKRKVDVHSARTIRAQAAGSDLHLDFGSTEQEYGIPFSIVDATPTLLPLSFGVDGEDYADESDRGPVPIPANARIEGGNAANRDPDEGDRHVITITRGTCTLTELYHAQRVRRDGKVVGWRASSAARWSLRSNKLRPATWTSADAAGLPIFPGLLRYEEAASGKIQHAIRFTLPRARAAYISPARHCGSTDDSTLPAYGTRLRLKRSFSEAPYSGPLKTIVVAMKRYGLMFADQGSSMYVTGTSDPRWADTIDQLRENPIDGANFEVVRPSARLTVCR